MNNVTEPPAGDAFCFACATASLDDFMQPDEAGQAEALPAAKEAKAKGRSNEEPEFESGVAIDTSAPVKRMRVASPTDGQLLEESEGHEAIVGEMKGEEIEEEVEEEHSGGHRDDCGGPAQMESISTLERGGGNEAEGQAQESTEWWRADGSRVLMSFGLPPVWEGGVVKLCKGEDVDTKRTYIAFDDGELRAFSQGAWQTTRELRCRRVSAFSARPTHPFLCREQMI